MLAHVLSHSAVHRGLVRSPTLCLSASLCHFASLQDASFMPLCVFSASDQIFGLKPSVFPSVSP